jgi:hypothetical protein
MQFIENKTVVSTPVPPETTPPAATSNYAAVRFNALKHGILSRYTVLPHEEAGEYWVLLAALIEDHQPAGATEAHLVEELAGIIWRKRRVLMAEGAAINRGLKSVASNSANSPIPAAVPFEQGLSGSETDLPDLMTMTSEEVAEHQRNAVLDLQATEKAAAILEKGGANAYDKALRGLLPDSRDWWQEWVKEGEYEATTVGLAAFINDQLRPACRRIEKEARYHQAIKAQTLGEGLEVYRLEKLNRYETHLDPALTHNLPHWRHYA